MDLITQFLFLEFQVCEASFCLAVGGIPRVKVTNLKIPEVFSKR